MQDKKPASLEALIETITPEVYENLKTAVSLGKWATGIPLTREQTEHCLQAIIAYEHRNIAVDQRVGFIRRSAAGKAGSRAGQGAGPDGRPVGNSDGGGDNQSGETGEESDS